jgi:nitroreductase
MSHPTQSEESKPTESGRIPLDFQRLPEEEMIERSNAFFRQMNRRRSVRAFSDHPVPRSVIENCLRTASTAPSGAHMQPWHFVAVSDPAVKREIRLAAEEEERAFYEQRAPEEWLDALRPFGTDSNKPFLETAPYLIAIFAQRYHFDAAGNQVKHYYVTESVGIATGLLIAAIHNAGLASLTHTPSPMGFLNKILDRPEHERPFLLLVVGYPSQEATVPDLQRKDLDQFATFI